jgi:hypothetical protein
VTGMFDFDGNPISQEEWSLLFFHTERHVALTAIADDVEVSTVFMGLDYGWGLTPAPLIYETMIFGGKHHGEQWRTPNRDAAQAAHDQAVALASEGVAARR